MTVLCALRAIVDTAPVYKLTRNPKKSAKFNVNVMLDTLLTNLPVLVPVQQTRISVARIKIAVGLKEASVTVTRKVLTVKAY